MLRRHLESTPHDFGYDIDPTTTIWAVALICFTIPGDLTTEDDVKNIMNTTLMYHERLDVLINNAGVIEMGSIENTSLDQLDRVMNANVR